MNDSEHKPKMSKEELIWWMGEQIKKLSKERKEMQKSIDSLLEIVFENADTKKKYYKLAEEYRHKKDGIND